MALGGAEAASGSTLVGDNAGNPAGGDTMSEAGSGGEGPDPCGDGTLEPGEECEPSLSAAEDRCRFDCTYEWYDRAFAKRRRVLFDNTASTEALSDFVVPVVLTAGDVDYASIMPGGQDLFFVADDDATPLPYEIEAFNVGGSSLIWVRLPKVPAAGRAAFWLYYQRANATSAADATQTWSGDYAAVYHFNAGATDSVNGSSAAASGTAAAGGQLAGALDFLGASASVDAGSPARVDDLFQGPGTITVWIRPRSWGEGSYGRIVDKASNTLAAAGWALELDGVPTPGATMIFEHGFSGVVGRWVGPNDALSLDGWSHIAVVYDGSDESHVPSFYINGAPVALNPMSTPSGMRASDASLQLGIGDQIATQTRSFDGLIDELRLERANRSAAWIHAEYASALPGAVTLEAEQQHL